MDRQFGRRIRLDRHLFVTAQNVEVYKISLHISIDVLMILPAHCLLCNLFCQLPAFNRNT